MISALGKYEGYCVVFSVDCPGTGASFSSQTPEISIPLLSPTPELKLLRERHHPSFIELPVITQR